MRVRRLDVRGGVTMVSAGRRRVPNLILAYDFLLYVVMPDIGPLHTSLWVRTRGGFKVGGFWRVIISGPQYEKVILLLRSGSLELPASSSSSGSGMIRGWTEACRVRERTTLLWDECKGHRVD